MVLVVCVAWMAPELRAQPTAAPSPSNPRARVLLVTGIDYPGHLWRETTPAVTALLKQDPRLQVQVTEDPNSLSSLRADDWDVIVLHFMNWEKPSPGEKARDNLAQFVRSGKGLVLLHFACGAWQDWPGFQSLAGRVWDPKLRGHDPHGAFQVKPTDPPHPITAGLQPFETTAELYTCLAGNAEIRTIATARSKVDGKDYPMAFVLDYGRGRVFHTVLGHDVRAITNSAVPALLRNGCAWVAGLPVR